MNGAPPRMLPPLTPENREFWTGGSTGNLRLPRCTACRRWIFPVSLTCPECAGSATYEAVSGKGTVFTHTTNHHVFNPEVPVPYSIAVVELADQEGLRFTTNIVNCAPESVEIGMPVRVVFEQHGEVFVPLFEPA